MLKLSGEALGKPGELGICHEQCQMLARQIAPIHKSGLRMGLVIGGGNLWRGARGEGKHFKRLASDHMGMLATLMNAIAVKQALEEQGVETHILNHLAPHPLSELYSHERMTSYFERGALIIFAGGIGHPLFTTDTAAALMALQMNADVLLKATQVNGIYDCDPHQDPNAKELKFATFDQVLSRRLNVLDQAAFALCQENRLAIRIFSNRQPDWFLRALRDLDYGSTVDQIDPHSSSGTL